MALAQVNTERKEEVSALIGGCLIDTLLNNGKKDLAEEIESKLGISHSFNQLVTFDRKLDLLNLVGAEPTEFPVNDVENGERFQVLMSMPRTYRSMRKEISEFLNKDFPEQIDLIVDEKTVTNYDIEEEIPAKAELGFIEREEEDVETLERLLNELPDVVWFLKLQDMESGAFRFDRFQSVMSLQGLFRINLDTLKTDIKNRTMELVPDICSTHKAEETLETVACTFVMLFIFAKFYQKDKKFWKSA